MNFTHVWSQNRGMLMILGTMSKDFVMVESLMAHALDAELASGFETNGL